MDDGDRVRLKDDSQYRAVCKSDTGTVEKSAPSQRGLIVWVDFDGTYEVAQAIPAKEFDLITA